MFTKGETQSSKHEVDTTHELARIRIHVECVIGLLIQKFKILSSTLPVNLAMCQPKQELSMIDKIVVVSTALCNCCESVVSFTCYFHAHTHTLSQPLCMHIHMACL